MPAISITDLNNAKTDIDHIADIATSSEITATDRLGNSKDTIAGAVYKITQFTNRGAWVTATAYAVKDLVSDSGTWYVCVVAHTSGATLAGDLATKWRVYQGVIAGDLAASDGATLIGHLATGDATATTTVSAELQALRDSNLQFCNPAIQETEFSTSTRDISDYSIVASGATEDRYHHSARIARDMNGRLHIVYSRGLFHGYGGLLEVDAVDPEGEIIYRYSDDGGKTFSAEQVVCTALTPEPINVLRTVFDCHVGVCPSGRVVIVVSDIPPPSSSWGRDTGDTKYRWFINDERGASGEWVDKGVFLTAYDDYARVYCGSIKRIPKAGGGFRMAFSDYRRMNSTPDYRIGMWYSDDEFETAPVEGTPIMNASGANNETDFVFVDAKLGFSVSRSDAGMRITRDGGATWTKFATKADYDRAIFSDSDVVAPTLDLTYVHGTPYVLLGWTHRGAGPDGIRWAASTVSDLLALETAAAVPELFTPWGNAYVSGPIADGASGYASPVLLENGNLIYVDCDETTVSPTTGYMRSDIRIVRANARPWFPVRGGLMIGSRVSTLTQYNDNAELPFVPTLEGVTTAGTPTYTEQIGYGVRIGRMYFFEGRITVTAYTGMVGYLTLKGFPYEPVDTGATPPIDIEVLSALAGGFTASDRVLGLMLTNLGYSVLYKKSTSGTVTPLALTDLGASFTISFKGHYVCNNEGLS